MDVVCSAIGLVILSPVFLLIAIAIRIDSPGAIFYNGTRVGQRGKLFHIHKFRTMVVNADKMGPGVTLRNDQRVTRVGQVLRKTKLDELPQLVNVLRGNMSLVGPRPESPTYVALYTVEQRRLLEVRPGITSLASIQYRDEEQLLTGEEWEDHYIHTIMPAKLIFDLDYVDRASPWQDLNIIWKTLQSLFR